MGLITGLLTLPLAPVRATIWVAEKVEQQAYEELHDPRRIRRELDRIEERRQAGDISEDEAREVEELLIERLMNRRGGVSY